MSDSMKRRIEKMETALGLAPVKPLTSIPRHMAEALHKIYGDPGEPVDYSITRNSFPALRRVYGDSPELLAMQEEAYAAQREAYGADWRPVDDPDWMPVDDPARRPT